MWEEGHNSTSSSELIIHSLLKPLHWECINCSHQVWIPHTRFDDPWGVLLYFHGSMLKCLPSLMSYLIVNMWTWGKGNLKRVSVWRLTFGAIAKHASICPLPANPKITPCTPDVKVIPNLESSSELWGDGGEVQQPWRGSSLSQTYWHIPMHAFQPMSAANLYELMQ